MNFRSVTLITMAHEHVSATCILLPLKQRIFCTVADCLHTASLLCVWATRPFECDEWAVDIEQRGWAAQPRRVDKGSDCAKHAKLSLASVCDKTRQ